MHASLNIESHQVSPLRIRNTLEHPTLEGTGRCIKTFSLGFLQHVHLGPYRMLQSLITSTTSHLNLN